MVNPNNFGCQRRTDTVGKGTYGLPWIGYRARTAQRLFGDVVGTGLLASATPKGPVSPRFPVDTLEGLFPRLHPDT